MQSLFPCFSPRVLPVLPTASLFLSKIGIYSNSLCCLTFQDFRCTKGLKPLILCGFLSSRDFSENLFSSLKVGITTPTRNQFGSNPTWVRIPPAAPRRSKLCIACSDFFKSQSALTPLLLLSKSQPLTLGCDLGPPLCGGFVPLRGNIDFNRPFHVGAKSALLRRLFMHEAKKTSSARFPVPPLQCGPHPNISGSSRIRQRCKRKSSQFLQKELHSILGNSTT